LDGLLCGFRCNRLFVEALSHTWSEFYVELILSFYKYDVVRFNDFVSGSAIALVCLRILAVSYQHMLLQSLVDLGIVFIEDENKGVTTNFTQVGYVRFSTVISLIWGDVARVPHRYGIVFWHTAHTTYSYCGVMGIHGLIT